MSGVVVDTSVWVAFFRGGEANRPAADALAYSDAKENSRDVPG